MLSTFTRSELPGTIENLRICNALQSEVIASMEQYQAAIEIGANDESERWSGRRFGYVAELSYLHGRRNALDSLIKAVERYCLATGVGEPGARQPEHNQQGKVVTFRLR